MQYSAVFSCSFKGLIGLSKCWIENKTYKESLFSHAIKNLFQVKSKLKKNFNECGGFTLFWFLQALQYDVWQSICVGLRQLQVMKGLNVRTNDDLLFLFFQMLWQEKKQSNFFSTNLFFWLFSSGGNAAKKDGRSNKVGQKVPEAKKRNQKKSEKDRKRPKKTKLKTRN